jgi:hypothetical protein
VTPEVANLFILDGGGEWKARWADNGLMSQVARSKTNRTLQKLLLGKVGDLVGLRGLKRAGTKRAGTGPV